jgi:hypothetical protein
LLRAIMNDVMVMAIFIIRLWLVVRKLGQTLAGLSGVSTCVVVVVRSRSRGLLRKLESFLVGILPSLCPRRRLGGLCLFATLRSNCLKYSTPLAVKPCQPLRWCCLRVGRKLRQQNECLKMRDVNYHLYYYYAQRA